MAGAATPEVLSQIPDVGPAAGGTEIAVEGTGLQEAFEVRFGNQRAQTFQIESNTLLKAVAPAYSGGSASVPLVVVTPDGESETPPLPDRLPANYFTYGPSVANIEPSEGPSVGGTTIRILGSGFTAFQASLATPFVRAVQFGSDELICGGNPAPWIRACEPVEFNVISNTEMTAISPPGSGAVQIAVRTHGGVSPAVPASTFAFQDSENQPAVVVISCRRQGSQRAARDSRHRRYPSPASCTRRPNTAMASISKSEVKAVLKRGSLRVAVGTANAFRLPTRLTMTVLQPFEDGRYTLALKSSAGSRLMPIDLRG